MLWHQVWIARAVTAQLCSAYQRRQRMEHEHSRRGRCGLVQLGEGDRVEGWRFERQDWAGRAGTPENSGSISGSRNPQERLHDANDFSMEVEGLQWAQTKCRFKEAVVEAKRIGKVRLQDMVMMAVRN